MTQASRNSPHNRQQLFFQGHKRRLNTVLMGVFLIIFLLCAGRFLFVRPLLGGLSLLIISTALWKVRSYWTKIVADLGIDGIAFERNRGPLPHFVPWKQVQEIVREGQDLLIITTRTKPIRVRPFGNPEHTFSILKAHRTRFQNRHKTEVPQSLRIEMQSKDGAYRTQNPPAEILVRVASDPHHETAIRIRAAELAVENGKRNEIEEVARQSANPTMRKHLEELLNF